MKNYKNRLLFFCALTSFTVHAQEKLPISVKKNQVNAESTVVALPTVSNSINGINNGIPNRISMNVTVAKQTQGATFGEKVKSGTINVSLINNGCIVLFSAADGFSINTTEKSINALQPSDILSFGEKISQGLHAAGSVLSQGSSLLGGAMPGGALISASVSSVGNLAGGGGGAAAASYAKNGKQVYSIPNDSSTSEFVLTDGEYELAFVIVEKATSGLKDTLKTQVKMGFSINNGQLSARHEIAKNSVNNVR
ncbi:hypothetical protein [Flavobacterium sp.]|uniref:hypothetical protein n=1 Tax=Flavobacterium sp. TaxID=239 RepID=UPI0026038CB2|nr:hypothetical protein [Flavobacterium sp.]MDG2431705.1 hypothetical protein [Flavobacterium sp.]